MNGGVNPLSRRVVAAPLAVEDAVNRLGRSLWLHLYLANVANHAGRVSRNVERIASDLKVRTETVEEWLSRLAEAKLVEIMSPAPFLVLKLRSWPGNEPISVGKLANGSKLIPARLDVPVSSSNAAAAAASSKQEDGGAGEGETLLREAASVTGESDREELRTLIEGRSPEVVRQALRRVRWTPASQIRKSRLALFRYLLTKLS